MSKSEAFMSPEDADVLIDELSSGTDQGCALIAAATLDRTLRSLIEEQFKTYSKNLATELFARANSPLMSFSAKINLCLALGLIDQDMSANLHRIRKVRNLFAHSTSPLSFQSATVAAECSGFVGSPDHVLNDIRKRFTLATVKVMEGLHSILEMQLAANVRSLTRKRDAIRRDWALVKAFMARAKTDEKICDKDILAADRAAKRLGKTWGDLK